MNQNAAILATSGEHLGIKEWPGAKHNPAIVAMFAAKGHEWVQDDETPWCAAFVGSVLAQLGLPHTGKLNARSYLDWGFKVDMQDALPGDVVVFWRGSRQGWQGHVAFLVRFEGDSVIVRGGNQGNAVSDAPYPVGRILGIRRHDGVVKEGLRPVLRRGDSGVFVLELQRALVGLGYTLGTMDDKFGSRTLAAVVAFQADHDLKPDGVVGPRTWAALLDSPAPRALRDKTEADLRARAEPTIKAADAGQMGTAVTGVLVGAPVVVSQVQGAVAAIEGAQGTLDRVLGLGVPLLVVAAVIIGGLIIWHQFARVKAVRVEDAQTGANDRV
jgi:uncharacterized protein (TIGR02594 family)